MVGLEIVKASNAQLRELGPNLVALFVGGTSGIGEHTAKEFVKNTISPRVYIVGRNGDAAKRIIDECKVLNKDGKVEFLQADVSELAEVDRVCEEIKKREKHINLIVQTQGNLNFRGHDVSPEGLDRKYTLNYYSRMRFISNLLPLLSVASTTAPHFSRSLSVLAPGTEGRINISDLALHTTFSTSRCANHSVVLNNFMTSEFATRAPGTSFLHSYPSIVNTGIIRELPLWARVTYKLAFPLMNLMMVSPEETGKRQLFMATSALYPPKKAFEDEELAKGISVPGGSETVLRGAEGEPGGGAYLVNWDCEAAGKMKLMAEYREAGLGKLAWENMTEEFKKVEEVNKQRLGN